MPQADRRTHKKKNPCNILVLVMFWRIGSGKTYCHHGKWSLTWLCFQEGTKQTRKPSDFSKSKLYYFTQCWYFTVWYLHRTFVASCQIKPCGKCCPCNNRESKVSHFHIYLQNKHFMLAVEMLTLIREKITMFRKELWVSGCPLYLPC